EVARGERDRPRPAGRAARRLGGVSDPAPPGADGGALRARKLRSNGAAEAFVAFAAVARGGGGGGGPGGRARRQRDRRRTRAVGEGPRGLARAQETGRLERRAESRRGGAPG